MIVPHTLPRRVEIGVTQSITLDVETDAGVQQTATAATVKIYLGNEVLVDTANATSLGPPAAYTLAGSVHSGRNVASDYLEVWNLTIGGTPYEFKRKGYLVIRDVYQTIDDDDLTVLHSELEDHRPVQIQSYRTYRTRAWERLMRDFLKAGRLPWLVFDDFALVDAHVFLSLHYIFLDWSSEFGESRYKDLADHYAEQYKEELGSLVLTYDSNQSGTVDEEGKVGAGAPIALTAGFPHAWRY